jgi:hypothetical protein
MPYTYYPFVREETTAEHPTFTACYETYDKNANQSYLDTLKTFHTRKAAMQYAQAYCDKRNKQEGKV